MKYTAAFEIARIALRDCQDRGQSFCPDVVREAALAAALVDDDAAAANAMCEIFERKRLFPEWGDPIA